MNCNSELHDEFKNMGEINFPFYDKQLKDRSVQKDEQCCENKELHNDKGMNVCQNCGQVYGYDNALEFIDCHENMYIIRSKSVYHRKYHIENILNQINEKHGIEINYKTRQRIYHIFELIDKVSTQVNSDRKRMISVTHMLTRLCKILEYKTTSKKTLKYYQQW